MAIVKIVPKRDWEVISKYLELGNGLILVPEENLEKMDAIQSAAVQHLDGQNADYDFGGEPDICIDIMGEASTDFVGVTLFGQKEEI